MRRPVTHCLDCGKGLEPTDNFCPNCGQENSDKQLSLRILFDDFLSNYFSFDSKLGRSLRFFFFYPGLLTKCYNEGKRVRFVHPLRLYLIITFLFFVSLSYFIAFELKQATIGFIVKKEVPTPALETDSTTSFHERATDEGILSVANLEETAEDAVTLQKALVLLQDASLEDKEVMDSVEVSKGAQENETFQMFFHQARRVVQKDLDIFIPHILKNLPVMMFLLLPLFALFLRFLFRNKPNLYIQHIIHSLHIHSMAFLLLTVYLLIGWGSGYYFGWIAFFLITLYAFLSIKQVYRQPWFRTGWKFIVLGMFYFSSLLFFVLAEITISFLTF